MMYIADTQTVRKVKSISYYNRKYIVNIAHTIHLFHFRLLFIFFSDGVLGLSNFFFSVYHFITFCSDIISTLYLICISLLSFPLLFGFL